MYAKSASAIACTPNQQVRSHGLDKQVRSHGLDKQVRSHGLDKQVRSHVRQISKCDRASPTVGNRLFAVFFHTHLIGQTHRLSNGSTTGH
jgi:hypothetical protein